MYFTDRSPAIWPIVSLNGYLLLPPLPLCYLQQQNTASPIVHSPLRIPKEARALIDGMPLSIFLVGLHCSPSSAVIAFIL